MTTTGAGSPQDLESHVERLSAAFTASTYGTALRQADLGQLERSVTEGIAHLRTAVLTARQPTVERAATGTAGATGETAVLGILDTLASAIDHLEDDVRRLVSPAMAASPISSPRELGLAAYIVKPVTQKDLRATVIKILTGTPVLPAEPDAADTFDRPLRILLAEDNVVNQRVAESMLSRFGHHVTVASDGQAAVDAYRGQPFDLILMDVQMPILSGLEATRIIRQLELATRTRVPIVAMTARAMKGDRELCLDAGMDDYLSKPIQGKRVTEVLRRLSSLAPLPAEALAFEAIDDAALLERVGGDEETLREVKKLCLDETPLLLDEIARALSTGQSAALAAAAHTLRGMCLVFTPNDVITIAGQMEDLARAGNLTAAAVVHAGLRPATDRLMAALRPHEDVRVRS